jgi:hypothetical protein
VQGEMSAEHPHHLNRLAHVQTLGSSQIQKNRPVDGLVLCPLICGFRVRAPGVYQEKCLGLAEVSLNTGQSASAGTRINRLKNTGTC